MKKLYLDMDSLKVESYTTGTTVSHNGTVQGAQNTAYTYCNPCGPQSDTTCYTQTQAPQLTCGGPPGTTCGPKTE